MDVSFSSGGLSKSPSFDLFASEVGALAALDKEVLDISGHTEVAPQLQIGAPLSSLDRFIDGGSPSPSPELAPSPSIALVSSPFESTTSVASLVADFSKRPRNSYSLPEFDGRRMYGLFSSEQEIPDRERFLQILRRYTTEFAANLGPTRPILDFLGIVEERVVPVGSTLFVQADLHSDILSLLELLSFWKSKGYMDEEYRTRPDCHIFFLGDYIDRGVNDIEVLSLILQLRLENPNTIHLTRGNHEEVAMSAQFALPSHKAFLEQHEEELNRCFQTFPLAFFVTAQEPYLKQGRMPQRQYVHMSHGLFPINVNTSQWLTGETHSIPILKRFHEGEFFFRPTSEKALRASHELSSRFVGKAEAFNPEGFMWNDVGDTTQPSTRGKGFEFSPQDLFLFRQASGSSVAKLCAFVRGHQHKLEEVSTVDDKVYLTTLPASRGTGFFQPFITEMGLQGLQLKVEKRVKDWKKTALMVNASAQYRPVFLLDSDEKRMYDAYCGDVPFDETEEDLPFSEASAGVSTVSSPCAAASSESSAAVSADSVPSVAESLLPLDDDEEAVKASASPSFFYHSDVSDPANWASYFFARDEEDEPPRRAPDPD